uniref:Myelin regulatory factor n=1 Tax=Cacopsylla melanoneura TaxID=428564 RepID=A0A8D8WJW5_9HEMI
MDGSADDENTEVLLSLSRNYFGGIDHEVLDFSQLDDYINGDAETNNTYFSDTLAVHNDSTRQVEGGAGGVQAPLSNHLTKSVPSQSQSNTVISYSHSHNLPESPPDSVSEPPYSPQESGGHSPHQKHHNGNAGLELLLHPAGTSGTVTNLNHIDYKGSLNIQSTSGETILVQHPSILTPLLTPQQPLSPLGITINGLSATSADNSVYTPLHSSSKKRKISKDSNNILLRAETVLKQEPSFTDVSVSSETQSNNLSASSSGFKSSALSSHDDEYSYQENPGASGSESGMYMDSSFQCIRFQPFQQTMWHTLWDHNLKELPVPIYTVDADKGFNFSNADDAFVCQKKNHFQITCHAQLQGDPQFVKTPEGMRKITSFHLHFYGVKVESLTQTIKVEQSQSDRSKKAFHPVLVDFSGDNSAKITVGRLHFSETTSNNMRKKGKPNPDQRYFYLVVGLHAHCSDANHYPIVSHASERIIVRASNPGQFESDVELCWQRGSSPESVFHSGRVGINTERPDEALVVHGNVKLTGHIIQPSDIRAKQHITKCNTKEQLRNVQQLNVVQFHYTPEFALHFGLASPGDTGIIAQEVQRILPEAVSSAGDVQLPDGTRYDNFLVVNKDRIFMESVGAVKELCKVTQNLENRIEELEIIQKELTDIRTNSVYSVDLNHSPSEYKLMKGGNFKRKAICSTDSDAPLCTNKFYQILVCLLILVLAFCVIAMSALYFLEFRNPYGNFETATLRDAYKTTPLREFLYNNNNSPYNMYEGKNNTMRTRAGNMATRSPYPRSTHADTKFVKHYSKSKSGYVPFPVTKETMEDKFELTEEISAKPLTPLGRPQTCNSISPQYPDTTFSDCQVFCCHGDLVSNVKGNDNYETSLDKLAKDNSHNLLNPQNTFSSVPDSLLLEKTRITPATNTIEENSGTNLNVESAKQAPSQGETKNEWIKEVKQKPTDDLLTNRKRRDTEEFKEKIKISEKYTRNGDLNGVTVLVKGESFTEIIGKDYCNYRNYHSAEYYRCVERNSSVMNYAIPLSKYLPDPYITIIFQFSTSSRSQKLEQCTMSAQANSTPCSWNGEMFFLSSKVQREEEKVIQPGTFKVEISSFRATSLRFRIPINSIYSSNVCRLPHEKVGVSFIEYNILLFRDCND